MGVLGNRFLKDLAKGARWHRNVLGRPLLRCWGAGRGPAGSAQGFAVTTSAARKHPLKLARSQGGAAPACSGEPRCPQESPPQLETHLLPPQTGF